MILYLYFIQTSNFINDFFQLQYRIPLHLKMLTSLRELYGLPEMERITFAWDELQKKVQMPRIDKTSQRTFFRTISCT